MVDKFTVDKIYNAAQIVDVVSDFVTLKKRGVNYVGLCPFHEDSTPSFYVSPSKNICKCFACGEGGTAVQFVMKHEQVSYTEALRYLAKKYGVEIKERELSDEEKQMRSDRESMMIVNSWAQKYFTSRLFENEEGKNIGMAYFIERGFREDTIKKFQLGYSLSKRDDLSRSALSHGFNESYLLNTGLVYKRDDGSVSDRFYGRVIFPVHTLSGKVVAFGGRVLGKKDKVAKYVNSPDSEIYHKSYELYGIYFAKQAMVKADKCFLVEGYTDVISLHQSGIENVVASSGTSLTYGQIRLIRRFTSNITVLYDGDAAGIKAAIRGIDMLLEEGMNVKIVLLPEGEDPDSFARSRNSFDFTLFIKENEVDFIRFKASLLLKDAGNDPMRRANLIKDLMESVAVIPDNIIRSVYIKECSNLLDESEQVLINEVMKIRSRPKSPARHIEERQKGLPATSVVSSQEKQVHLEESKQDGSPQSEDNLSSKIDRDATDPLGDYSMMSGSVRSDADIVTEKAHIKYNPFKKYESALVRYIVRYGERILGYDGNGEESMRVIKVAEYISKELERDDIEIQTPLYRQILDEAVEQCKDENFVASHFFLSHTDLEISRLAAEMISSRYQLSRYFIDENDTSLKLTTANDEKQLVKEKERKANKEREQLERWIIHDLFAFKYADINNKIDKIKKQIREFESDDEKGMRLLRERMALDNIRCLLSKELGDRIITGIGR